MKPGNVLLLRDGRVALADLGLAARWPPRRGEEQARGGGGGGSGATEAGGGGGGRGGAPAPAPRPRPPPCPLSHRPPPPAGTRWYRPPEALYGGAADDGPGADLWGAGCVLAEALGLSAPLAAGETDLDQVARVAEALGGAPGAREWPGARDLPDFAALAAVSGGCWGAPAGEGEGAGEEWEEGEGAEEEEEEEKEGGGGGGGAAPAAAAGSRRPPPSSSSENENENGKKRDRFAALLPDAPVSALDLLSTLLSYDPARRGTAEGALAHAYFREHPLPASRRRVAAAVAAVIAAAERERAQAQRRRLRQQQQQGQRDEAAAIAAAAAAGSL